MPAPITGSLLVPRRWPAVLRPLPGSGGCPLAPDNGGTINLPSPMAERVLASRVGRVYRGQSLALAERPLAPDNGGTIGLPAAMAGSLFVRRAGAVAPGRARLA